MRKDMQRFKRYIEREIRRLENELVQCRKAIELLEDFSKTDDVEVVLGLVSGGPIMQTGGSVPGPPTRAIRKLFEDNPEKEWTHFELLEIIEEMLANNEIASKQGRAPENIVYNSLNLLTRKGEIVKLNTPSGKSVYIKTNK